jgi:histidine ammonia-lyase
LALEILCAAQAIALQLGKRGQGELRPGKGTQAACRLLRSAGVEVLTQDRVLYPDIRKAVQLVRGRSLVRAAREAAPEVSPC